MIYVTSAGAGGGGLVTPMLPTAAGVALLPNTGGSRFLLITSIVSIVAGSVILLSAIIRFAAKKFYRV